MRSPSLIVRGPVCSVDSPTPSAAASVRPCTADHFYRLMPDTPSADDAAVVLHRVIQHLRAEHTGRPHLWASLIHSGP